VGEHDVVVLGEEADRGRRVRVGTGSVGKVEQLPSLLIGEGAEFRAEALDDLAQAGEAAPLLDVVDRRRAERPQVPHHDGLDGWVRVHGGAEPGLRSGVEGKSAAAPDSTGRDLDQRNPSPDGVAEGQVVAARPPLGETLADPADRAALGLRDLAACGDEVVGVHADQVLAELPLHRTHHHRLEEWPEGAAVSGTDEMDRRPHHPDPDHLACDQHPGQLFRAVCLQPCPQGDIRIVGVLGLEPKEVLDGLEGAHPAPLQKELAGQQCTIEGTGGKHLRAVPAGRGSHAASMTCRAPRRSVERNR
jgi:hypothetical protein